MIIDILNERFPEELNNVNGNSLEGYKKNLAAQKPLNAQYLISKKLLKITNRPV